MAEGILGEIVARKRVDVAARLGGLSFADLAAQTPETAILATNTSALSISDLGATTGQAGRVIGLHFFNPVSRMKLVEVVVGKETAPETVERALAFTRQIAKLPVVVQDSPGFLVNRVLFPYLLDAAEMFELGVDAIETASFGSLATSGIFHGSAPFAR